MTHLNNISDWISTTLLELCSGSGSGIITGPFGSQLHAADYVLDGVPCVMPQDIVDNRIDISAIARVSVDDVIRLARFQLREGDIVYPRRGNISKRALVRAKEQGWLCGTGCLRLRPNTSKVLPKWLAYYLSQSIICNWLEQNAVGATMPHLNTGLIGSLSVVLPPLPEQRAIARILGALDDKIELNRTTSATLEEMARTLYRSWFVDFDPVHAKAEGRAPAHMDEATAALFPERFGEDGLPEGWRLEPLGTLLTLHYGKALPKDKRRSGAFKVYGSGGSDTTHDEALVSHPTIIVGRKGTIGSLYWESSGCWPIDTVYYVTSRHSMTFIFQTLQHLPLREMNTDAAVPGLNRENAYRLEVVSPSDEVLAVYALHADMWRSKIDALARESRTLAELRDTLLPKLMSGELRVPEAEAQVEAHL